MNTEHFDVLVVGAGISGIAAGYHLQTACPGRTYAILERRDTIGGTWDLFRYPGIRSDSDMYTLGYPFRPWTDPQAIADGPAILRYVNETAREFGSIAIFVLATTSSGPPGPRRRRVGRSKPNGPTRRSAALHLQLSLHVQRLLQLRRRLHPGFCRNRALSRPGRAPAAVDR